MFVTPNVGDVQLLKYMLNYAPATNAVLHLYSNNITPSKSDILSNYTEVSSTGYSSMPLTGLNWTFATVNATSSATYPTRTFSVSASATAYGWYMTDNVESVILFAEKFIDGPYAIPATGGTVAVNLSISAN